MSDYHYAAKFTEYGCGKCGGANANSDRYRFRCEDCGFSFP